MIWGFSLILVGFSLGVTTVFAVEGLAAFLFLKRLKKKNAKLEATISSASQVGHKPDNELPLDYALKKEGFIWLLESDKIPQRLLEKAFKEKKRKKDFVDVYPVRKYGKVEGNSLFLLEPGGFASTIQLKGCTVVSVSGSILPSRKWVKRFPIKLESKNLMYNGNKILYIFLDTSWDKESWCKALRLASCEVKEKLDWFSKLHDEFNSYLASLNAGYYSSTKPALGVYDPVEQTVKPDGSSSRVHRFWRRFSKKNSSAGGDNKSNSNSHTGHEEKRNIEKLRHCQDAALTTGMMKSASTSKPFNICSDESMVLSASSSFSHPETHSQVSVNFDADPDEKFVIDEGTLCWNLLMSRLFFDAKGNSNIIRALKALVQNKLSKTNTPSYIGEVVCVNIDMGSLPPHIVSMKVLPMEMDKVWAIDLDIEYSGGILFDIETRLEVRELDHIRGTQSNSNSSISHGVSPDLLEGIEHFKEKMNPEEGLEDMVEPKDDANTDESSNRRDSVSSTSSRSRWKCILNSIAEQVSQVPLSLAVRVASLKGTLRFHIKPPPSDQLWYGFTSMPDIEFNLESSIGERKISNGHVALYLVNRFKAAIRETLVFPNWENQCIPWMIAEKNDWVPQTAAPYAWRHHESKDDAHTSADALDHWSSNAKRKPELTRSSSNVTEWNLQKSITSGRKESILKSSNSFSHPPRTNSSSTLVHDGKSWEELKTPLIPNGGQQEEITPHNIITLECQSSSNRIFGGGSDREDRTIEPDDSTSKKLGKMEKMMDLRKKMGEKFERKKRHFEEKSRSLVERMRNNS